MGDKRFKKGVRRPTRAYLFPLALAVCSFAGAGGLYAWYINRGAIETSAERDSKPRISDSEASVPKPPQLDLTDADHAVVALLRSAETEVKNDPRSGEAWGNLGKALLAHDFESEAATAFVQAHRLQPNEPRWPYLQGISLVRSRPEEAIPLLQKAVDLTGEQPLSPKLRLFELYLQVDQLNQVELPLTEFLSRHPDNARARIAMARLYLRQGKLDECLNELKRAEREPAAAKQMHELRAEALQRLGRRDEADAERRLAANTQGRAWPDPWHAEAGRMRTGLKVFLDRSQKLFTAGKVEDSKALLQHTIQDYPDSEWAWILLGRAQIRLRQLPDAEISLNKALEINSESADARFRMGVVQLYKGLPTTAIDWFNQAIELKPDHPVAYMNIGLCYQQKGETDQAIEHFRTAIDLQPDYFDAHFAWAELLARLDRKTEAREMFERARALKPDDPNIKRWLSLLPAGESN